MDGSSVAKTRGKGKRKSAGAVTVGGPARETLDGSHLNGEEEALETKESATRKPQGRGKPQTVVRIEEVEEHVEADDQEEPTKPAARGRGRPRKDLATGPMSALTGRSSAKKRKSAELEPGHSARPIRAAAESAKSSMAEQSVSIPEKS